MVVGSHKRMIVYNKTGMKCSICGSENNLTCVCFIPEWTRIVSTETENLIPLCDDCRIKRGKNFIEIGELRYLPELFIEQLLRFYMSISQYLHKYVKTYGKYRVGGDVDIEKTLLVMSSYDQMISEEPYKYEWEEL